MRYFLILNPGANSGKSFKRFDRIFNFLNSRNIGFEYRVTDKLEDAYTFSKNANISGYEVIVAVGGDGTINKVLNGFYDDYGKRISKSKFAVIYTGTSPDFCQSYGIPLKTDVALDTLLQADCRKIKIGKIIYIKDDDSNFNIKKLIVGYKKVKVSYFACCANIGIGASIARGANKIRKYFGDFLGTFMAMIGSLTVYKPHLYTVSIDNTIKDIGRAVNISIGITKYIASGIKVCNELGTEDKRFYFLAIKNLNFFNVFKVIRKIYSGKPVENSNELELMYLNMVYFERSINNNEIEFDGDPAGFLPCYIECAEELELIC